MLAFPSMLLSAAEKVGMKTPAGKEELDKWDELPDEEAKEAYPHFWVFCKLQLCRSMSSPGQHWDNAKVIADIPLEELKTMTLENFLERGFSL